LEEVKTQLEEQVRRQKMDSQVTTIITALQAAAEIVRSEDLF